MRQLPQLGVVLHPQVDGTHHEIAVGHGSPYRRTYRSKTITHLCVCVYLICPKECNTATLGRLWPACRTGRLRRQVSLSGTPKSIAGSPLPAPDGVVRSPA